MSGSRPRAVEPSFSFIGPPQADDPVCVVAGASRRSRSLRIVMEGPGCLRWTASMARLRTDPMQLSPCLWLSVYDNMRDDETVSGSGAGHAARAARRNAVRGRRGALGEVRRGAGGADAGASARSYSLTLHAPDGARLVGFDNAHSVRERRGPGGRRRTEQDHRHRLGTVRPYGYEDAATLLEDFWKEVDRVLRKRGSIP